MSLNDVASLNGRKKAIRSRAPIIPKLQSSSYQKNTYCELDPTVFPAINILPLHQATNTMYANIPTALQHALQIYPKSNHITTAKQLRHAV